VHAGYCTLPDRFALPQLTSAMTAGSSPDSSARTERRLYTGAAARTLVCDRAASQADRFSPMGAGARGPRVKPSRPPGSNAFAPADRRFEAGRNGSASGSDGQAAEAAARAGPWRRLEDVQEVLTEREAREARRQDLGTGAGLWCAAWSLTHRFRLMLDTPAHAKGVERDEQRCRPCWMPVAGGRRYGLLYQ
jgi:hypothetical protein